MKSGPCSALARPPPEAIDTPILAQALPVHYGQSTFLSRIRRKGPDADKLAEKETSSALRPFRRARARSGVRDGARYHDGDRILMLMPI